MNKSTGVTEDYFAGKLDRDLSNSARKKPFKLDDGFIAQFVGRKPNFGFNGLGEFVFYRTYSRIKEDGGKESVVDTFSRVVEGTYEIQRRHCAAHHIPWTRSKAQKSAQEMFTRMWQLKFLPPGRGLWTMGTKFMWERGGASLNNCAFKSTQNIDTDPAGPFHFMTDMSMVGVGVGFDTRGAGKCHVTGPHRNINTKWVIEDSREGWADSVKALIESHTIKPELGVVEFDYSLVRSAGTPIKGFGGQASGPGILAEMHIMVCALLDQVAARQDNRLSSVDIVDIMNMIGKCVVAGNVRRSAQVALGDADDFGYCTMKNPIVYAGLTDSETTAFYGVSSGLNGKPITVRDLALCPIDSQKLERLVSAWNSCNSHRWASNNSLFCKVGMDYSAAAASTAINGEPGYLWLDNIRNYGRMVDGCQPGIDAKAMGANPCLEQSLEDSELCTLVETFPAHHNDAADYHRTLKFAYLYAKTVTLLPTHNAQTNAVMLRNRRIGLSQSGIVQAFKKFGRRQVLLDFCDAGYKVVTKWDDIYSDWLCVGRSKKKSSVKPSGSVSLVAGSLAGIHFTIAPTRSYWRNVRVANNSPLLESLQYAGYRIEPDSRDAHTSVVRFGVNEPNIETVGEISIWEQVKNAVDYQRYWADNQVSCTIQFKPSEAGEIHKILEYFDDQLKGISFLPLQDHGYHQAPYLPAHPGEVEDYNSRLGQLDFSTCLVEDVQSTKFCDGDVCHTI